MRRLLLLPLALLTWTALDAGADDPALSVAGYGDSLTGGGVWIGLLPATWSGLDYGEAGDECWNDVGDRLLADLADPGAAVHGADAVVVFCGTNDVRSGVWTLEKSMDEITAGADAALAQGFLVAVVAPPPIFYSGTPANVPNARLVQMRDALASFVTGRRGSGATIGFANVHDLFWAEIDAGTPLEDLYSDGVHPIGLGRQIIADEIVAALLAAPQPGAYVPSLAPGALLLLSVALAAGGARATRSRRGAAGPSRARGWASRW